MHHLRQEVALKDLRIFAFHGFYPEEQVLGNEFLVDVTLGFSPPTAQAGEDDFERTVDYEIIYHVIKKQMAISRKLLEEVCRDIFHELLDQFPFLSDMDVCIRKSNPPFGGDRAHSSVRLTGRFLDN